MSNKDSRFYVPLGPQHPALKEPVNFVFLIEGEKVVDAQPRIGYAHRGIEKLSEKRTYLQNAYLFERVCGICSGVHQATYCFAAEKAASVEIPRRAAYIRGIVLELERLHSHLLWLGIAAHEVGFDTLFMYLWKDRELVMDLLEMITGNRVNYGISKPGGVRRDIDDKTLLQIRSALDTLSDKIEYYKNIAVSEGTLVARLKGVGILKPKVAKELGATGPTIRGSGIPFDVRKTTPYPPYDELDFKVITYDSCDMAGRTFVRVDEMFESVELLYQMIDNMPSGEIETRYPRRVPPGETIFRSEPPRGELIYYIKSNGTDKPERIKVRTPTLANIQSIAHMLIGNYVADIPVIVAGIDPCISCMERVAIVDLDASNENNAVKIMSKEELRRFSLEWYKEQ